jgi:ketosteroid isomerase-like protein
MIKKHTKNIQTVLDILQNEVDGNISSALKKMTKDYSMTWVYRHPKSKKFFPSTKSNIKSEMEEVYPIKGRQYDIKNIAEGRGVVMIELIESYPDQKTKKVHRTPLIVVLEMERGKIKTGRHYCDPDLSYKYLTKKQVEKAYKNSRGSRLVIK